MIDGSIKARGYCRVSIDLSQYGEEVVDIWKAKYRVSLLVDCSFKRWKATKLKAEIGRIYGMQCSVFSKFLGDHQIN